MAFFHGCGYIAKPRWQSYRKKHGYESTVSVALEVVCAASRGRGEDYSRYGKPIQISDLKILAFLTLRGKKELLFMEFRELGFLKLCSELQRILMT